MARREAVVVIGSNSFSGAHFVDRALAEGLEVAGVSRSPQPPEVFLPYCSNPRRSAFQFRQLDVNRDWESILALCDAFRPDYIVNFAAQGMVAQSWQFPEQWLQTNLVAQVRLHEALRARDYLKKFVHASTPEVYGPTPARIAEDAPCRPTTPYAVSKAACDMSLLAFHRRYGFPAVLTRSANVFGPGQRLYRVIPRTIMTVLTGGRMDLRGGDAVRSFVHIRDVARATLDAARRAPAGEIFHLGTERELPIRDLIELVCRRLGTQAAAVVRPAAARPGEDAAYLLDCSKARRLLDWRAGTDLEAGIDETIAWAKRNLALLKAQPREYVHQA
ncbi:MAG: GDP-mannose 4,6-dehydratase [Elusimicrobia bacterium]|nr:GDP-mannose 4,6-dehydratase [Elusimicrobiota bacterium]